MSMPRKRLLVTYEDGATRLFESLTIFCDTYNVQNSYMSVVLARGTIPEKWYLKHRISSIEVVK